MFCAGGSSGIGLALTRRLAAQGLNVVVVAMPDAAMASAQAALAKDFPSSSFRFVGTKLGSGDYIADVAGATADIPVTLVFNNAGYMKTGFLEANEWQVHADNIGCNAVAAVALSHLFVRRIKAAGLRGCITFTSSPAGFMPSPFSVLYGSTKAMLTHFATSLAGEVRVDGIDVCVIHPSPVNTAFYTGAHNMPTLKMFQSTAGSAENVADCLLRSVGRCVIVDQGYYSVGMRLMARFVDPVFLAEAIARSAHRVGDYKVLKEAQAAAATAAVAKEAAAGGAATKGSGGASTSSGAGGSSSVSSARRKSTSR